MTNKKKIIEKKTINDLLKLLLIIIAVVSFGFLAINQVMQYYYSAEFLKSPCKLCGELNPEVSLCIKELNTKEIYPDGSGGWFDPTNISIRNIK